MLYFIVLIDFTITN